MDLVDEDRSRVGTVFFLMSEDNVRKQIQLPWVSFGSDAGSHSPRGVFLKSMPHPRAYGNFARLLGRYVREEKLIPLAEAIRRLTSLPATNLGLDRRGRLKEGFFADVVVFDPATIADRATFEEPHQYAVGSEARARQRRAGAARRRAHRGPPGTGAVRSGAEPALGGRWRNPAASPSPVPAASSAAMSRTAPPRSVGTSWGSCVHPRRRGSYLRRAETSFQCRPSMPIFSLPPSPAAGRWFTWP